MQAQLEALLTELKSLWRFRWPAAIAAWSIALIGWVVVLVMPPSFEAQARDMIKRANVYRQAYYRRFRCGS